MKSRSSFVVTRSAWTLLALAACTGGGGGDPAPGGGAADFSLLVLPSAQQVAVGSGTSVTVRVVPENGFDSVIDLEVTGVPAGLSCTLSQTAVRGGDVELVVTAVAGTPGGSHPVSLIGRSGALERSATFTLEIVDQGFDFALDAELRALPVAQGGSASTGVVAAPRMGTVPAAAWTAEGLPAGISATFTTLAPDRATLALGADGAAAAGTHEVTVVATAGTLRRETTLLVHVLPQPEVTGLAVDAPAVVQVRRGAATAAQLELARATGVTGLVALQVDGLPAGVTASYDDNPARGAVALLRLAAGATVPPGESVVTVTATDATARGTAHLLLQVVGDEPLADVRIQRAELAQSYFARDPGLVGGKPALLRAHVLADRFGVLAPVVRVEAFHNGASLGRLDLGGPPVLPTAEDPANLSQSFRVELPAAWMRDGLELALAVDPDDAVTDREERNDRARLRPNVGAETRIDLVVVPLRLAGRESQAGDYRDMLLAHWPLADVAITVRAPYTVTSVQDVGSDGTGWTEVLSEIAALRSSDGSNAYYYGVVPVTYGGGVAGVGYVGYPVAIGWSRTAEVVLHEIGHNFGLSHAPCGGASSADPSYPFPNAAIGTWGYDRRSGAVVDPRATVDLMSYCRPDWISGYNHERVRVRLAAAAMRDVGGGEVPLLMVRGRIDADGAVALDAVRRLRGRPAIAARGDLELRLGFARGRSATFPVASVAVGCGGAPGERHFDAVVPDPGELEVLEVQQQGRVLARQATRRAAMPVDVAGAEAGLGLALEERDGVLRVRWNAAAWPDLGVVHVGARRTTLALALRGGDATVSLLGVPAGGAFEIAAADGIDGFTVVVPR